MSRNALMCHVVALVCFFGFAEAGLASTWDSCNCRWDPWKSWSSCTETCGGGTQTRERSVWNYDTPECEGFEACATNDMGFEYRDCNEICYNGGTFSSSWFGNCNCPKRYKGTCCEQVVTCGSPSSISNGQFTGSDFTYANQITYHCNANYNMTDPTFATRTCQENGVWSGQLPQCLYAVSCNSSPCQNNATCVNLLGDYNCECIPGWSGKNCEVDIQPPEVHSCPSSRFVFVSNLTSVQTWTEPTFTDPHGFPLVLSKNYETPSYEFPWGVYAVAYTANKPSNGMSVECLFNVSVKPHPCKPLDPPENGILVCNGWNTDYANVCKYYCKTGYQPQLSMSSDLFVTCGASGNWLPVGILPDCIPATPLFDSSTAQIFGNCSSQEEIINIASVYIEDLKKSELNKLCLDFPQECQPSGVHMTC